MLCCLYYQLGASFKRTVLNMLEEKEENTLLGTLDPTQAPLSPSATRATFTTCVGFPESSKLRLVLQSSV